MCGPILDIRGMGGSEFYEIGHFSFLTIFNEITFFKTQCTRLFEIFASNKDLIITTIEPDKKPFHEVIS